MYFLFRGFISSTRAFNLLNRPFHLLNCAFNLPTRAFCLLNREFELIICGFELVTRGVEFVTREFELVTCEFELVTRGFELVTRNSCFTFPHKYCPRNFHYLNLMSLIMNKIPKLSKNTSPIKVESFLMFMFDFNQTCQIVFSKNC